MEEITIEDFIKIDLRIAKIIEVNEVEDADKLIQLKLDIGDIGTKTVFAGFVLGTIDTKTFLGICQMT